jgi:tRNA-Thr(GGU) m(6)t(6)A37 methyltransferase TsaA
MNMTLSYRPIGVIRTPFTETGGMPIQPSDSDPARGIIELHPEYVPGLRDLGGFSHIILLYHFHRAGPARLSVVPFMDEIPHGIFATRAPLRPNPIGISTVRLESIEEHRITVLGIDVLDGTPLLDIKPFYPLYDNHPDARGGWLGKKSAADLLGRRSDSRYTSS